MRSEFRTAYGYAAFKGYTTASNLGPLGLAVIETPIVDFVMKDLEDEEPFFELHGSTADVTISGPFFIKDHGISTIKMTMKPKLCTQCDLCFAKTLSAPEIGRFAGTTA
jgi:hypothetical protein